MKRIRNTLGSQNIAKKITFQKFIQNDSTHKTQRTILLQLEVLHDFLLENGILARPKVKPLGDEYLPPLNDIYMLHLQRLAVLDRTNKTYNMVYHASLHNQMTKVLFLALFTNNNRAVQKILSAGYPSSILRRCVPLYLYFCAQENKELMSSVSYKSVAFFGLGANIILSFKGLANLSYMDYDFMTVKQFLLFNEYRGINTIDKKTNQQVTGFCGYSSESSVNTSNTEAESSENEKNYTHTQEQFRNIKDDIDHRVLFPLDFMCIKNDFRAVDNLLQHSPDFATLSTFCFLLQCHAGITLKLLQYRADPNQTFRGYTPLHAAARLGNLDVTAI